MSQKQQPLNPVTTSFEWGGPFGAAVNIVFLPFIVLTFNVLCDTNSCSVANVTNLHELLLAAVMATIPQLPFALIVWLLWLFVHSVIYLSPLGERVQGQLLRNGKKLTYHMNAIHAFVLCHVAMAVFQLTGLYNFADLADHFMAFAIAAILISLLISVALYLVSFRSASTLLALGGNSGHMLYDFWVGRELNPRMGALDFKFMMELRPGLIGWSILNWCFVIKSFQQGQLPTALVLASLFESWYVFEGLYFEAGNLTMMDIVHDGLGYMLVFGDLAWVPFLYTLQCRFLFNLPQYHELTYLIPVVLLWSLGYTMFRGANSQKDTFRKNPKDPRVVHLEVMKTSAGKSLIISGFWGICRHPNYVGDWLMVLALSLLTGTGHVLVYFQPIYFAILLIHRQLRDEQQMQVKYGTEDWNRFCQQVPYRLIPYIY